MAGDGAGFSEAEKAAMKERAAEEKRIRALVKQAIG